MTDDLREQLLETLNSVGADGELFDTAEEVDAILPIVTAWADRQARKYAAQAIRWAVNDVHMAYGVRMDLRARADWIRAGHRFESEGIVQ